MTISQEELPRLLEQAARAMGYPDASVFSIAYMRGNTAVDDMITAELNAALNQDTLFCADSVIVGHGITAEVKHNGTTQDKLRAWREASLRAAAMVGERMMG